MIRENNKTTNIKKSAFSFIELSIVLLVIAIVISMFFGGTTLVKIANLTSLRSHSQKSPVYDLGDATIWFDVARSESFIGNYPENGDSIASLKDVSPYNETNYELTQGTAVNQPTFIYEAEDNLPSIYFDGDDTLTSTSSVRGFDIAHANRGTIFLVSKYISGNDDIFKWEEVSTNRIRVNMRWSNGHLFWDWGNNIAGQGRLQDTTPPAGFDNSWNIITLVRQNGNGIIRVNASETHNSAMTDIMDVTATANIILGSGTSNTYLREFILFKRELTTKEIEDVEKYLSQKWEIDID